MSNVLSSHANPQSILEADGYQVFTASSGTQALRMLSTIAPNLVLLDMKLDDMTGNDFLMRLEVQDPQMIKDIPVVFYSGVAEVGKSKAKGFIRKSGNIHDFLNSIHGYIQTAQTDTWAEQQHA